MKNPQITIFLNGNLQKSCQIRLHPGLSIRQLLNHCQQNLQIPKDCKCKFFDSAGGDISDDDLQYLTPQQPLFLSQGEQFSRNSSLAIYDKLKPLGKGGFGSVWLYRNKLSHKKVAIKFVQTSSQLSSDDVSRAFSQIGTLRTLRHNNIVQLIDAFPLQDDICFVMQYCSGGTLKQYLEQKGALEQEQVYMITCQIAQAMRYCHNSKIVHRDLKLENIMFANKRRDLIKIVDFGIAGMFTHGKYSQRSDAGTLSYVAPEVLTQVENRANPALDVWSIGCIIYCLLTNSHPFYGKNKKEIAGKILKGRFRSMGPEVGRPWHLLVKKMLRVRPRKRWSLLEVTQHLFKHRFDRDASLTEDSEEEVKEDVKVGEVKKVRAQVNRRYTIQTRTPYRVRREITPHKYHMK